MNNILYFAPYIAHAVGRLRIGDYRQEFYVAFMYSFGISGNTKHYISKNAFFQDEICNKS